MINNVYNAPICCYAFESCKFTDSMFTNLGSIYCLGSESCSHCSMIWISDSGDDEAVGIFESNIYCMGYSSCSQSTMQSTNSILCSSPLSCDNGIVLSAKNVYCTMNSCKDIIIRQVENVYLIDIQQNVVIYSGHIDYINIYFRGIDAGDEVTIYCNDGDVCTIDCGYKSCNNETTLLYCFGKCFVTCHQDWSHNNSQSTTDSNSNPPACVNLVTTLSPSAAPSKAPTNFPTIQPTTAPTSEPTNAPSDTPTMTPTDEPTVPPTNTPTATPTDAPTIYQLLTQEELSSYFNIVLGLWISIVVILLTVGIIHAKINHNEASFQWSAILSFSIYSIDFFSDVFFSCKLYTLWIDPRLEYNVYYMILFAASLVFIVFPILGLFFY